MSYSRILIAVDSSESSINATVKGFELAKQLGAKVALLFVIDIAKALGNVDAGITSNDALIILKKEAEQTLSQLANMFDGPDVLKFMPEGHPSHDIIKTAESWASDLIIIGSHGKKNILTTLMGSVSDYILNHSNVPILIIPMNSM